MWDKVRLSIMAWSSAHSDLQLLLLTENKCACFDGAKTEVFKNFMHCKQAVLH